MGGQKQFAQLSLAENLTYFLFFLVPVSFSVCIGLCV